MTSKNNVEQNIDEQDCRTCDALGVDYMHLMKKVQIQENAKSDSPGTEL